MARRRDADVTLTIWIGPDGDDANPGTRAEPVYTFPEAMRRLAPDGGVVKPLNGIYDLEQVGPLRVPPNVSVIGPGRGTWRWPWWRRLLAWLRR